MTIPKISIIIPMYNAEKYIEDCLKSIFNQKFQNIEVIIVNDGSIDRSLNIVYKYMKLNSNIKVVNKENGGVSKARNIGIKESKGKYLLFLDSDDYLENNSLKILSYYLEIEDDIDVIIFNAVMKGLKKERKLRDSYYANKKIENKEYLKDYFLGNAISSVCTKLWKRELFIKNGIFFPENFKYGEDGITMFKLLFYAKRIIKIDKYLYYYRENIESAMHKKEIPVMQYLKAYNKMINFLNNKNDSWFLEYEYSFKLNFVYEHLLFTFLLKERRKEYLELYREFKNDNKKKQIIKLSKKNGKELYKYIMYKFYNYNFYSGEFLKMIYNCLKKMKDIIAI